MSYFFNILGQSAEIDVYLDGQETRKWVEVENEDRKKERMLLYYDGESVSGKVNIILKKSGPKLEHQGIKIEFIGQIEILYDRGNHHEFTNLVKELARPGELMQNVSYPFEFARVEKPFEIYSGINVRLRYFLKVTIIKRMADIVKEIDIAVHALSSYPEVNNPIKMEVGIEDCLHIEFEYNKSKYHLRDVIVGKIYFLLVRIKIKHMDLAIIKRETTGQGSNCHQNENETVIKYQIMDGAPVKGESIPIRVFLAGCNLTPTMRDINKKFSVRYFLNLVLMDMEDRRYFKQQEITLWRKGEAPRKANLQSHSLNATHLVNQQQQSTSSQQPPQQQPPPVQQMHTADPYDGTNSPPLQIEDSASASEENSAQTSPQNESKSPTEPLLATQVSKLEITSSKPTPAPRTTSANATVSLVPDKTAEKLSEKESLSGLGSSTTPASVSTVGAVDVLHSMLPEVPVVPVGGIETMTREAGDGETRTEPMIAEVE